MNKRFYHIAFILFSILILSSCAVKTKIIHKNVGIPTLKFLDVAKIKHNQKFKNTTIGGLSSIDYDAENQLYYFICDDRSAINPARYYTAKIAIENNKIAAVDFVKVDSLRDKNKNLYPNMAAFKANATTGFNTPDPEELRYHTPSKQMVWSSEGERILGKTEIIKQPSITLIQPNGNYIDEFPIPEQVKITNTDFGARKNGVFEGMSFTDDYKKLFVSVEIPLYQDGPEADIFPQDTWCRILKYQFDQKKLEAQYAYPLDPVQKKPISKNAFKLNGISSILAINETKLLVVERSFSLGHLKSSVRVYLADLEEATDINKIKALSNSKGSFKASTKKLLLNFDDLGIYIDNIEGITFGPKLANGHRSVLFVTDNNFMKLEKQQIFLFELIP